MPDGDILGHFPNDESCAWVGEMMQQFKSKQRSNLMKKETDYYAHIYSQRDVDLIRGDLMQRIAELTTERDELKKLSRSLQHYLDLQDDWRERRTYSCWENEKRQTALTRARAAVVVKLKRLKEQA